MSSVWTGMACEAGKEERGPKVRDPSPLDLHWSNLEIREKRAREEGKERSYHVCCGRREGSLTRVVLLRGS